MKKVLTMVLRYGKKGMNPIDMGYVFIAQDYSIIRMTGHEVVEAIKNGRYYFTNMGLTEKGLTSTNGAFEKYTLVDVETGMLVGNPSPVIINRVEVNGNLVGYTIYSINGTLEEVDVKTAVAIHARTPFANGKIRHTSSGDIISSIEGNYPLRQLRVAEVKDEVITVNVLFFSKAIGAGKETAEYAGALINSSNAATLSKLFNRLSRENEELKDKVRRISQRDDILDSFNIQITKTAGFYGVFPLKSIFELMHNNGQGVVKVPGRGIMIACVDYTNPDDYEESNILLNKDLTVAKRKHGTEKGDAAVERFAKEVASRLRDLNIQ